MMNKGEVHEEGKERVQRATGSKNDWGEKLHLEMAGRKSRAARPTARQVALFPAADGGWPEACRSRRLPY